MLGIYSVITDESRTIVETKSTVEIELGARVYSMCYNQSDKFLVAAVYRLAMIVLVLGFGRFVPRRCHSWPRSPGILIINLLLLGRNAT